jgi:hypothetical protein
MVEATGTSHRLALALAQLPVSADTIDESRRPLK